MHRLDVSRSGGMHRCRQSAWTTGAGGRETYQHQFTTQAIWRSLRIDYASCSVIIAGITEVLPGIRRRQHLPELPDVVSPIFTILQLPTSYVRYRTNSRKNPA